MHLKPLHSKKYFIKQLCTLLFSKNIFLWLACFTLINLVTHRDRNITEKRKCIVFKIFIVFSVVNIYCIRN